ncbi:hypothetical protein [Streptomyces sp. NPDC002159]
MRSYSLSVEVNKLWWTVSVSLQASDESGVGDECVRGASVQPAVFVRVVVMYHHADEVFVAEDGAAGGASPGLLAARTPGWS